MRKWIKKSVLRVLFVALAMAALLWPLFYNRFPIVLGDTLEYTQSAFRHGVTAVRPSYYPFLIRAMRGFETVSPLCWIQAFLAAVVLEIVLIRAARVSYWIAGAALVLLGLCTTAPWWVCSLMPDCFFGIAVLALAALTFGEKFSRGDRVVLWIIAAVSLLQHIALPPVVIVMGAVLIVGSLWRKRRRAVAAGVLALGILGFLSFPLLNRWGGNGFAPSAETSKFILARMAGDGLMQPADIVAFTQSAPDEREMMLQRLQAVMATPMDRLNGYLSLPSARTAAFLHSPQSPLSDWAFDARLPTFGRMIRRLLVQKPIQNVESVVIGTGRLLAHGEEPEFVELMRPGEPEPVLPQDQDAYSDSRQNFSQLHLAAWNRVIVPVYWAGFALCIGSVGLALLRRKWLADSRIQMAAFLLVFVILHAAIVYTLSGDFPRYQSRMSWVVVLGGLLGVMGLWRAMRANRSPA